MTIKPQVYDDSTWALIKDELLAEIKTYFKNSLCDVKNKTISDLINKCQDVHHQYKNNFPWAFYYFICFILPFSFLLIIPAYWCFKKFKALHTQKKILKAAFDKANSERIENLLKFIHTINFSEIIDQSLISINYVRQGPLPGNFINIINKHANFDHNWILDSEFQNPICSSWAIFNQHMLILNIAQAKHWLEPKVYVQSITVPYITTVNGKTTTCFETVTATMTAPFPRYSEQYKTNVFTAQCEKLEFTSFFNHKENYAKKYYTNSKYAPLENKMFNKEFPIARSNEQQIRMYYTVDVQEYFVNQLAKYKEGHKLPLYFWWSKKGPLIYSNFDLTSPFYINDDKTFAFVKDVKTTIQDIFENCSIKISNIVKERYLSLNAAANLPILQTEYSDTLIKNLKIANQPRLEIYSDEVVAAHWIYKNIWVTPLLKTDTKIMPVIKIITKEKVGELIIVKTQIKGHFYHALPKTKIISAYGARTGLHLIPVPYIDYKNDRKLAHMYYCCIGTNLFLKPEGNNLPVEILKIFNQFKLIDKIRIKRGYIVFLDNNDIEFKTFKTCINTLWSFLSTAK